MALPMTGFAATFDSGETVDLSTGSTLDDNYYAGGGMVAISDEVTGDVYVAGSLVTINSAVGGDVVAAGSVVNLYSDVAGDVRVGGSMVNIGGNITGEAIAGGSLVHVLPDAVIHGNLYAWGAAVIIDGTVKGSVETGGAAVTINGVVGGDVLAKAEEMKVGGSAQIAGMLTYTSPEEGEISEAATIGSVVYEEYVEGEMIIGEDLGLKEMFGAIFFTFLTIKLLALLLVAMIITLAFKKCAVHTSKETYKGFWSSLGIGVVAAIVAPIVILLLCLSLVGFYLAAIVASALVLIFTIAAALAPVIFGSLLHKLMTKSNTYKVTWWSTLLGFFIMMLIMFIPVVGMLLIWLFILAVYGALLRMKFKHCSKGTCCK